MANTGKVGVFLLIALIAFALFFKIDKDYGVAGIFFEPMERCFPQEVIEDGGAISYSSGGDICVDGAWIPKDSFFNATEGETKEYCEGYFYGVKASYLNGTWNVNKTEIKGTSYCIDGTVYESPANCGNWKCDEGETELNCWFDCGVISSWKKMKNEENNPDIAKYLQGSEIFDVDSEEVAKLTEYVMEQYQPLSPAQAVKDLTRELQKRVYYVPSSDIRNPQVGDTPDDVLKRGFGNCVDYTVVMISALRHGFDVPGVGVVKIPARQVGGCVSNAGWRGTEFSPLQDQFGFHGRILAHVWTEVWGGKINGTERWGMADPTTNQAILKDWFGYFRAEDTDEIPIYYLPVEYADYCRGF